MDTLRLLEKLTGRDGLRTTSLPYRFLLSIAFQHVAMVQLVVNVNLLFALVLII